MENLAANNYDDKLNYILKYYTPTEDGKIYSERRGKYLAGYKPEAGYDYHTVKIKGTLHFVLAHRLVAYYFIHNPNQYPVVNHLDGDKFNNCVKNLDWTTYQGNTQHSYDVGLRKSKFSSTRVFTEEDVKFIRLSKLEGKKRKEVIEKFPHVGESTFEDVWYNNTYKEITV